MERSKKILLAQVHKNEKMNRAFSIQKFELIVSLLGHVLSSHIYRKQEQWEEVEKVLIEVIDIYLVNIGAGALVYS